MERIKDSSISLRSKNALAEYFPDAEYWEELPNLTYRELMGFRHIGKTLASEIMAYYHKVQRRQLRLLRKKEKA